MGEKRETTVDEIVAKFEQMDYKDVIKEVQNAIVTINECVAKLEEMGLTLSEAANICEKKNGFKSR